MKIEKYKYLGNGKYKIFFEKEAHIFYEDIIIKYNILSKQEISKKELDMYLFNNQYYDGYYKAIKYINYRLRSRKEIYKYLEKQEISKDYITKIISTLEEEKYIDDNLYAISYINDQIHLKNFGPLKIAKDLVKLGIKEDIINKNINIFTKKMQHDKIKKYIDKQVKANKKDSTIMLKNKILNNLIYNGYYKDDIVLFLDNIMVDEKDLYDKEYNKLYNKLSKKYSGYELEQRIKQKLYIKGLLK